MTLILIVITTMNTKPLQSSHYPISITCLSLNIQSLPSKYNEFLDLINQFFSNNIHFDIIALQELWTLNDPDIFAINGYKFIFKSRKKGTQGGGVGFYIKKDLNFRIIPEYSIFVDKVFESIFVEISGSGRSAIVSSIYRPNGPHPSMSQTQQLDQFCEMFSNILIDLGNNEKQAYIFGDFNIDLIKYQNHEKTFEFINDTFSNGFLQLVTKPTRCNRGSASLIDHFFTNCHDKTVDVGILTTLISDHFAVFASISTNMKKSQPKYFYSRNLGENNRANFKTDLENVDWQSTMNENNPQLSFDMFLDRFNSLYEVHFPLRKIRFNKNIHKKEPFMTKGIWSFGKAPFC